MNHKLIKNRTSKCLNKLKHLLSQLRLMTVQLTLSTCLGQGSRRNITHGKTVESIGSLEGSRRVSRGLEGSQRVWKHISCSQIRVSACFQESHDKSRKFNIFIMTQSWSQSKLILRLTRRLMFSF